MSCEAPASPDVSAEPTPGIALPASKLVKGGRYKVRAVVDGDTVTLSTGKDVRMVGTQAPKLPLGRPGFKPWPLGDAAKDYLSDLVSGEEVTLHFGGLEEDRHGRWLAHLERGDGLWLQGAMLEAGYARVYTFPDNRSAVAQMLAAESAAREAKRGIWNHPYYAVRTPKQLERDVAAYEDTYQIVRGRVESTGQVGGRLFINFGGDWDTDFTAVIQKSALRKFKAAPQFDPENLEGSVVEIRGWIEDSRGPSIDVTHPEQISTMLR
ncbi:MAG: thermonuclease family protein [Pseudomonadota bacterium]